MKKPRVEGDEEWPGVVGQNTPQSTPALPPPPPDADAATTQAYNKALKSGYEYHEWAYHYRRKIHEWQDYSSQVVFWVCIAIVVAGLGFSWCQFKDARKMRAESAVTDHTQAPTVQPGVVGGAEPLPAAPQPKRHDAAASPHTIEATTVGVKVSTSVLGVVILALSLGFFYLYLQFVYPIKPVAGP